MNELDVIPVILKKRLERRILSYPLISPEEALNEIRAIDNIGDPNEFFQKEKNKNRLLVFNLANDGYLLLPKFQFHSNSHGVLPIIPQLCTALCGLNDLSVYFWLTSYDDDLKGAPADYLKDTNSHDFILDLAYLLRNTLTFRHL
ncbi:hypothetical protein [Enterovibrio nigricans]|uniref:Uncharacterized protein n=1 Tax=Enterovibrio nigricans DSM 22720 TaxID=1121868 RepID=A0A1T4W7H7_9GAMM|nr:hypothetical protein [Enterovibrio nigricans]PKF48809.1 hypothetical protein AT251_23435 [Enterovibrio nigricans]SKA73274.1 hypothetical protein SAMN02745132_04812 [Enterovibrio nigricans DSM 22720]